MDKLEAAFRTSDFDYELPQELIAQHPSERRGESRLLVVHRDPAVRQSAPGNRQPATEGAPSDCRMPDAECRLSDLHFSDFPGLVNPGDVVVLNTTRVRHARLIGRRPSGAPAEVLLLHPESDRTWIAMGKPGPALRPGKRVSLGPGVEVEVLEVLPEGYRRVRIAGATPEEAMARFGKLPLPPYITREPTGVDEQRYQTVFAARESSVAAPTAGLHFTPELLDHLKDRGATLGFLELEVGPGTFQPVEEEDYSCHPMHPERYTVPEETAAAIAAARARGSSVWAVGTTVVRALESAATGRGLVASGPGETRLMIAPGYEFRAVDRLLTNFHLPRSTLLMLVAAFAGYELTRAAYRHAIASRYRFYSYGDAMAVV